jgi:hypothetical protein
VSVVTRSLTEFPRMNNLRSGYSEPNFTDSTDCLAIVVGQVAEG